MPPAASSMIQVISPACSSWLAFMSACLVPGAALRGSGVIQDAISRLAQLSCGRPVLLLPLPVSSNARALPSSFTSSSSSCSYHWAGLKQRQPLLAPPHWHCSEHRPLHDPPPFPLSCPVELLHLSACMLRLRFSSTITEDASVKARKANGHDNA